MCGIAGYIGKKRIDKAEINSTLELMKNRGPDHRDYITFQGGSSNIVLLNSRLSIIDLDERSNQPFTIGDYTIVFNGEIYNYIELKESLKKKGVKFKTESDTEVLLQSYINYGEECVKYFEGMWSFAIYDQKKEILFLSRDRFAEKPLYIFEDASGIFFASEIKFIRSLSNSSLKPNQQHIFRYLINNHKSLHKTDETFFNKVQKVPYATNMIIKRDLQSLQYRYWQPVCNIKKMSLNNAVEGFRHHLFESIRKRLRADVPLAFCLSGGIDSSAITSIAAKHFNYDVSTFSIIDPDPRYNELENIETTIADLGCKNTIIHIPQKDFIKRLTNLICYHDAPVYTSSYYIHSFLSESIGKQKYKVACSGTAADELVTGYYDHYILYLYEMRNSPKYKKYLKEWENGIRKYTRNSNFKKPDLYFNNPGFRDHVYSNRAEYITYLKPEFNETFAEEKYCDQLLRNRMMNEVFHEQTPAILRQDDLNSMLYSIENRSPYLDTELFEFCYSIPTEYLIQKGYAKYILREATKGILNESVRLDRRKVGFNASIHSLINLNEDSAKDFIFSDSEIYNYIKRDKMEELMKKERPLSNNYSKFLFRFMSSKIFLDLNG